MQIRKRCTILKNRDFIFVVAESGRIGSAWDFDAYSMFLPINTSSTELGESVFAAFLANRWILDDAEMDEFTSLENVRARFGEWVESVVASYGYCSKAEVLENLALVNIDVFKGNIEIEPSIQVAANRWTGDGVPEDEIQILPSSSTAEKVGNSILKALQFAESNRRQ